MMAETDLTIVYIFIFIDNRTSATAPKGCRLWHRPAPTAAKNYIFGTFKAECSACGVSIPNYDWEARLEEDNRNAEKAFGVFNRTLSRMAYSMWGTKLRIARLVLTFLPAVGFILPWSNIKGTGSSFVLSYSRF